MEVAMAIAVIAAGLFIALGVFFIICSLKSIKSSHENETRIKGLEDSLDNVEKLISERTSYLAAKLEESSAARVVAAQPEKSQEGVPGETRDTRETRDTSDTSDTSEPMETYSSNEFDEISLEDLLDDDFEDWLTEEIEEAPAPPKPTPAPAPIVTEPETIILTQAPAEPASPLPKPEPAPARTEPAPMTAYPPSNHHIGYDVGKSGRKYTASELEDLIRA